MPNSMRRQPTAAPKMPAVRWAGVQGTGQQLGQCHPDHDARRQHNGAVQKARREEPTQEQPRQHRPERLGQAGDERGQHTRGAAARCVSKRHGHSKSFRDIVQGDGRGGAQAERRIRRAREEGQHALREIMQQQRQPRDKCRAHGRGAGRVSAFAKAGGQCSFLGQEPPQQTRGQHPERQQRHNRSAAGQRRQVAPVKRQRLRHQVGQRRREHDPARKARAGRQQTFRRRAEHSQQPAQAGGQPGEGGKYDG